MKDFRSQQIDYSIIDFDHDYRSELKLICGSFYRDLSRIFPNELSQYVLLTQKPRRRIWSAYLSGHYNLTDPDAVREKFLFASSKSLLQEAYGDLPNGFLGLVRSKAVDGLTQKGFRSLYVLLSTEKINPLHLHNVKLTDHLLEMLHLFPSEARSVKVAQMFDHHRSWEKFLREIEFFEQVTGMELRISAYNALRQGMKPKTVITHSLKHLTFPAPILRPCEQIQHIGDAAQLHHTAKAFENCLFRHLPIALAGQNQYYIFKGKSDIVFSIEKFTDKHWKIDEIQSNEIFASVEDFPDLQMYLEDKGIHTDRSDFYRAMKGIVNI